MCVKLWRPKIGETSLSIIEKTRRGIMVSLELCFGQFSAQGRGSRDQQGWKIWFELCVFSQGRRCPDQQNWNKDAKWKSTVVNYYLWTFWEMSRGVWRCPWGGGALFVFPKGEGVSFSNFGACSEGALGAFASDRLVTHVIVGPCDNQRLWFWICESMRRSGPMPDSKHIWDVIGWTLRSRHLDIRYKDKVENKLRKMC